MNLIDMILLWVEVKVVYRAISLSLSRTGCEWLPFT